MCMTFRDIWVISLGKRKKKREMLKNSFDTKFRRSADGRNKKSKLAYVMLNASELKPIKPATS